MGVQTCSLTICDYVPKCFDDGPLNYSRTHVRMYADIGERYNDDADRAAR